MLLSIVGARPNFIKLGPIAREAARLGLDHHVLNTNQHQDAEMNAGLFRVIGLPPATVSCVPPEAPPSRRLSQMIGAAGAAIEELKPSVGLIYGDVMSALAGALAARLGGVPIALYGSGVRSGDRSMPEEANRRVIDFLSDLHLISHTSARDALIGEGVAGADIVEVGKSSGRCDAGAADRPRAAVFRSRSLCGRHLAPPRDRRRAWPSP